MTKAATSNVWALPLRSDGQRYSKAPITAPLAIARTVDSASQITLLASGAASALGTAVGYRYRRNGVILNQSPTASSYVDTGLNANTAYSYTATFVDSAGNESDISSIFVATTPASSDTIAPTVPVIASQALTQSTIRVTVTTASTDAGSGLRDYTLEHSITASGPWDALLTGVQTSSFPYTHAGLNASTQHYYRLNAFDVSGNVATSAVVSSITNSSSGGTGDVFADRDPDGSDIYLDLDRVTNGTGTNGSPYQKSQVSQSVYAALQAGRQFVILNPSGNGAYTPIALTSGMQAGTAQSRIVVRTLPGHVKAIWNFPASGLAYAVNFWRFRDLNVRSSQNGFRFGYGGWDGLGPDITTGNVHIIDCVLTRTGGGTTDNSGIVTAAYGSGNPVGFIGLYRNAFNCPLGEANNQSGFWADYMRDFEVIGNTFLGGAQPIYFKHTNQTTDAANNGVIKNNMFMNSGIGLRASINWAQWLNNAFQSVDLMLDEDGGSPAFSGSNNFLSHNTFLNSHWLAPSTSMRSSNNTSRNNVMIGSGRYQDSPFASNNNGNNIDFSATDTSNHYSRASQQYNLAGYRTAFPGNEANGLSGPCTLVGGTNPGLVAANWALANTSIGRGNASDGGDRGVNSATLGTVN